MSTITNLQTTDNGVDSLAIINTNIENLNSDKLEANDTVELTNKTIDADSNTISNLESSHIKAISKTGIDTRLVTGVAGASDSLTKWNSDGDLVDSGFTIDTDPTLGGLTPSATKLVPQSAIKTYMDSVLQNAVVTLSPSSYSSTLSPQGFWHGYRMQSGQWVNWMWKMPSWASTVTSAKILIIPDATESINFSVYTYWGALGDASALHNLTDTTNTTPVTVGVVTELDVTTYFANANPDEWFGLRFYSTMSYIYCMGSLVLEYE